MLQGCTVAMIGFRNITVQHIGRTILALQLQSGMAHSVLVIEYFIDPCLNECAFADGDVVGYQMR